MAEITPEMLSLASIVSIKIQTCVTRYEDEEKKKKKWVVFAGRPLSAHVTPSPHPVRRSPALPHAGTRPSSSS